MVVTCQHCQTKFRIDDAKVGPKGVKVRCSKCANTFVVGPLEPDEPVTKNLGPGLAVGVDSTPFPPPAPAPELDLFQPVGTPRGPPPVPPPLAVHSPAPPASLPPLPQAPAPMLGDDLFADPFAAPAEAPAPLPPPQEESSPFESSSGLELDRSAAGDPLADLPRFQERPQEEDAPDFAGSLSSDGMVTRQVKRENVNAAEPMRTALETVGPVDPSALPPVVAPEPKPEAKKSRGALAGRVGMSLVLLAGFVALSLLYRAGGWQAVAPNRAPSPAGLDDVHVEDLALAPYVTAQGRHFWLLRGVARNRGSGPLAAFDVRVELGNGAPIIAAPGVGVDVLALYEQSQLKSTGTAIATLAPGERASFAVVVAAERVQPGASRPPPRAYATLR